MKRQFLHEHHARRDKTRDAVYRQGMAEERVRLNPEEESKRFKQVMAAKQALIESYRKAHFGSGCYCFRFGQTLKEFADYNRSQPLHGKELEAAYKYMCSAATHDLANITDAIRAGSVSWSYNKEDEWQPSISFSARTVCEFIYPDEPPFTEPS